MSAKTILIFEYSLFAVPRTAPAAQGLARKARWHSSPSRRHGLQIDEGDVDENFNDDLRRSCIEGS